MLLAEWSTGELIMSAAGTGVGVATLFLGLYYSKWKPMRRQDSEAEVASTLNREKARADFWEAQYQSRLKDNEAYRDRLEKSLAALQARLDENAKDMLRNVSEIARLTAENTACNKRADEQQREIETLGAKVDKLEAALEGKK